MKDSKKRLGEASAKLFGAALEGQGKGVMVGLELLALIDGSLRLNGDHKVLTNYTDKSPRMLMRSSDLARRLATRSPVDPSELDEILGAEGEQRAHTELLLQQLLEQLLINQNIMSKRRIQSWFGAYFFPYEPCLIHYDAVDDPIKSDMDNIDKMQQHRFKAFRNPEVFKRKKTKSVEPNTAYLPNIRRYKYRGGGSLAHLILRTDPDYERLERTRTGFTELLSGNKSSIAELMHRLNSKDLAQEREMSAESGETRYEEVLIMLNNAGVSSRWLETLRRGVDQLVSRRDRLAVPRIMEMLIDWVPYCLARFQIDRAADLLEPGTFWTPVVCMEPPDPTLRRQAREEVRRCEILLRNALERTLANDNSGEYDQKKISNGIDGYVGFTIGNLAISGMLSSLTGSRYVQLKPNLLRTICSCEINPKDGGMHIGIQEFFEKVLWEKHRLIVDPDTADEQGLTQQTNWAAFQHNSRSVEKILISTGYASRYSDATVLVRGEPK